MVIRVAQQAQKSTASHILIATDSKEIESACLDFPFDVMLTKSSHTTGTDRLSEVVANLGLRDDEIIVNVQGDEPFIPPELINLVAQSLQNNRHCAISTVGVPIKDIIEVSNPNVVKIVRNHKSEALYFSRAPIPFKRDAHGPHVENIYLRHLGIYAYQAHFLKAFSALAPAPIEQMEALEQLRALWYGYSIAVEVSEHMPPLGVDTYEDLEKARLEWKRINPFSS
jgi:3-deoxy-manno-octulosonate cytidylyltransferase (CMP-KDO synthetase)